jgi:hypothetical protein
MKVPVIAAMLIAAGLWAVPSLQAATITGCLKGPNSEGVYDLTNTKQKGEIEVGGNSGLAEHVGHTVELTGEWVKSGADIGEKEEAGHEEAHERHFKVSSIKHLAAGCK